MGLNDYPQFVNDKMTMTNNDKVGWFRYASLCLHYAFAPKVEARRTQNGMKHPSTSPIRLSDEPFFDFSCKHENE